MKKLPSFIRAEFFDIFGVFVWIFFILISIQTLKGTPFPHWAVVILLLIGIAGLLLDGFIVYRTYLKKN
jgi:hypothetical protein